MFVPNQGAYKKKGKVLMSLKMQTMAMYKKGTYEDGSTNYPICCNYAQRFQCIFAQNRAYSFPGSMSAPMQGAYEGS